MACTRDLNTKSRCHLVLLTVLMLFTAVGFGQESTGEELEGRRIAAINTAGNVTIERAEILSKIRTKAGEVFSVSSVEADLERLATIVGAEYAYYNAKAKGEDVELTFVLVEKNLVRSISFNGNKNFDDSKLSKELGFHQGDHLDTFLAGTAVEAMEKLYLKKGYAFIEIKLDREKLSRGEVAYDISEGPRVKVRSVEFTGNKTLASEELKKVIKAKSKSFLVFDAYYTEETVQEDVAKLKAAYTRQGFWNVKINVLRNFSDARDNVDIIFAIDEGPVYIVQKITISGNKHFSESELRELLKLKEGAQYSEQRGLFDADRIRDKYLEQGFLDTRVDYKDDYAGKDKAVKNVEFSITEGERYKVGRIDIVGNENVEEDVIRRVLDEEGFKPGRWYNAETARGNGKGYLEKQIRYETYAEEATVVPEPEGSFEGSRNARVSISESKTGSIMLGAGIASDDGLIGHIIYDQRNFDIYDWPEDLKDLIFGDSFKGAGQHLRVSLQPGTVYSSYSISFTERYLYNKPIGLNTAAESYERWREGYNEDRLKGSIGLEKRYEDKWRRGISFRAENVDVSNLEDDAPIEIRDVEGGNSLFGARFYVRRDTRNDKHIPSAGQHFTMGYEQVAGDHTFGIIDVTNNWYKTLHEDLAEHKTILETKIYAGAIVGDAPPFEKFYAGGRGGGSRMATLRGFDYRGVSPRGLQYNPVTPIVNPERKDPIGSDWILAGSAQVAVPLDSEVLSWLFFVDTGMIDSGGIRASVGTGIQILIPQWFGPVPMRFEFAAPFMKDSEDETEIFSFSAGALF